MRNEPSRTGDHAQPVEWRGPASLLQGAIAHDGRLELTPEVVRFVPTSALARQLGVQPIEVNRRRLAQVSVSPDGAFLTLHVDGRLHRFSGKSFRRLVTLLEVAQESISPSRSREPTLIEAIVEVQRGTEPWWTAQLRLTPATLTLRSLDEVRGAPSRPPLTLHARNLPGMARDIERNLLVLTPPGAPVRLRGGPLAWLAALLTRLHNGDVLDEVDSPWAVETTGGWMRGPVLHKGAIRFGDAGVCFEPDGLLDSLIGVEPFTIPWSDVSRIEQPLGAPHVVTLISRQGDFRFHLGSVGRDALVRALHHAQVRLALKASEAAVWSRRLLQAWQQIDPVLGAVPQMASPALHLDADETVRVGMLALTARAVRFLPRDVTDRTGVRTWPVDQLSRLHAISRTSACALRFEHDGEAVRLIQALGPNFERAFWRRCRAPARVVPWDQLSARTRARISGEAPFVRVTRGLEVYEARPGQLVDHPRGWGVLLAGSPADAPRVSARVLVEVGQPEGVYHVDAEVLGTAPEPPRLRRRGAAPRYLLLLRGMEQVRVFNQREGVRVPARVEADLRPNVELEEVPRTLSGTALDLSIGGCLVLAPPGLALGQVGRITLQLPSAEVRLNVEVVRVDEDTHEAMATYGVRFVRPAAAVEDRIHRFVLRQQRRQLSGEEEEPIGGVPAAIAP